VDLPGYVFADINLKMAIPLILLSVKLVGVGICLIKLT